MPFNEDMPNYNRKNPFVIQCKMTRDDVDETALSVAREIIRCGLICGLTALISLLFAIPAMLIIVDVPVVYLFGGICIGLEAFVILIYIRYVLFIRKYLITDGLMDEVDKEMNAEVSEILRMNNENIINLTKRMTTRIGELSTAGENLLSLWMSDIILHGFLLAAIGITAALLF